MPSGTPINLNKKRKSNKATWLKNATRSLGMIGVDYLSDIMPGTMDIAKGLGSTTKEVTELVRNTNINGARVTGSLQNNRYVKLANTTFKNALEDVKTGNFNNQERMMNAYGGGDSGMTFGDLDSDTDVSEGGISDQGVATLAEISTKNAEAMIKSTQASMNAQIATNAASMVQNQEIGNLIASKLDETNRSLAAIVEFNNTNFTKFIESSTAFMEKTGRAFTAKEEATTSSNKKLTAIDIFTNKNGGLDSSVYKDYVKQQTKKYLQESQLGSMASMIDSVGDAFAANPIPFIAKFAIDAAIPEMAKSTMEGLDEAVSGAVVTMMKRMTDSFKDSTDSGLVGIAKRFLGNSLGFKKDKKNELDLSNKITADAATFDGFTYNSINQVIPKYLRESTAYLKVIAEEVSGRKNIENDAQYFDNSKGKYVNLGEYRKNFYRNIRNTTANSVLETKFGEAVRRGGQAEGVNSDEYNEMMNELFYQLSVQGAPELNGNWKGKFDDIISNLKGSDKTKAYLQSAINNTVEKQRGGASMVAGVLAGSAARSRMLDQMEANPAAYDLYNIAPDTSNFNASMAKVLYGETDESRADRKMKLRGSIMDKLSNINFLLERGINVRMTGKKAYRLEDGGIRPSRIGMEHVSAVPDEINASGIDNDMPPSLDSLRNIDREVDEAQRDDIESNEHDGDLKGFIGKFRKRGLSIRKGIYDILTGDFENGIDGITDAIDSTGKLKESFKSKFMQEGSTLGKINDKIKSVKNTNMSDVKNSILDKLFGKRESRSLTDQELELFGDNAPSTVHTRGGGLLSWFKEGMFGLQKSIFGIDVDPNEPIEVQRKKMKEQYADKSKAFMNSAYDKIPDSVKNTMKYIGDNAGAGAAGGITGFLLGGPLGAAVGSTIGFATKSKMFQDFVYGKEDENGNRSGGFKDKVVGAWHKFATEHKLGVKSEDGKVHVSSKAKMIAASTASGFIASFFTPVGPIGGALGGLAVGLASSEGKFHRFLFGEDGDDGKKRKEGLVGSIGNMIDTHWLRPMKNTLKDFIEDSKDTIQHKILNTLDIAFDPISQLVGNMVGGVIDSFKYKMSVVADNVGSVVKNSAATMMDFLIRPAEKIGNLLMKTKLGGFLGGAVKKVAGVLNPMNIIRGAAGFADKANRKASSKRYLADLEREKRQFPERAAEIDAKIAAIKSGDPDAVNEAETMFYKANYKQRMEENDKDYDKKKRDKKSARAERDKRDNIEKFISDMTDGKLREATAENLEIAKRNFEQRSANFHRSYRGYKRNKIDFDDWGATIQDMNPDASTEVNEERVNENIDNIDENTNAIKEIIAKINSSIETIENSIKNDRNKKLKYGDNYQAYKEAMDNDEEDFLTEEEFNQLGTASNEQYHELRNLEKTKRRYTKKKEKSGKKAERKKRSIARHHAIDTVENTIRGAINNLTGSGYENGTEHASEGFHVVGEERPEIVYTKEGAKVDSGKRELPVRITGFNLGALGILSKFLSKNPLPTAITASTNILPTYLMGQFNSKTDKSEMIKKAVDGKGSITTSMVAGDQYDDSGNASGDFSGKKSDDDKDGEGIIEKAKNFFSGGFMAKIIDGLKGLAGGLSLFAGGAAALAGLAGLKKVIDVANGTDPDSSASNSNTAEIDDETGLPVMNEDGTVKQKDATEEDKNATVTDRLANFVAPNRTKVDTKTGKASTEHVMTNKSFDKARAYTMGTTFALTKAAPTLIKKGVELAPNAAVSKVITTGANVATGLVKTFRTGGVKLINQIGDKLMGFLIEHGHEKAAEGVMKILDKILPSISDDVLVKNSGAISKFFGGLAEKANMIGLAIELASIGIGGINGATSAGHLFDVNMKDENISTYMKTIMVLISTAVGCFKGSMLGSFIDLISLLLGTDFIKILANKLLDLILNDDQEKALDAAQENFKLDYEEYSKKEYEAYKKNAEANNQEAMSYEDFKNDDKISTSYDEYNDDQNSGVVTKAFNSVKNALKPNKTNASNSNAQVYSTSSQLYQNNTSKAMTSVPASSYLQGGSGGVSNVPYYSQNDPRWRNAGYGTGSNGTMGTDGCGPTAFAMAASGAGKQINPMQAASFMQKNGYRDETGTNAKGMGAAATAAGLSSDEETNPSSGFVQSELSKGKPVVLLGRSGGYGDSAFTQNGHYVVATGTDNKGNVMINDPRGQRYSGKYKLNNVLGESAKAWAMGGKGPSTSTGTGVMSNDVVKIANNEVGYIEKNSEESLDSKTANGGNKNYTKYERDVFGSNGNYWCASFVSWVVYQAANRNKDIASKVMRGNLSKSANGLMNNFANSKTLIDRTTSTPMPGDIVFFHNTSGSNAHAGANHVGIVVSVNGTQITTVEGNTSSKKYDSNGGCVSTKTYSITDSKIIGFGRPLYDNTSAFTGVSSSGTNAGTTASVDTESTSNKTSLLDIGSMFSSLASKMATSSINYLLGKGFTTGEEDADTPADAETDTTGANSSATVDGSNGVFVGSDNAEVAWNYYRSLGYSKAATAAILGNLQGESGMNPSKHQNGGGPAAGIAQWENAKTNTGRYANLVNFAKSKGTAWNDLKTQLEFVHNEVSGSQSSYFTKNSKPMKSAGATPTTYDDWKSSNDVEMATRQFEGAFERAGTPRIDDRINYANGFYKKYGANDSTTYNGKAVGKNLLGGSGGSEFDDWIDDSPKTGGGATFNSYTASKGSTKKFNKFTENITGGKGDVDLSVVIKYLEAIAENTGLSADKLDKLKALGSVASNTLNKTTNLINPNGVTSSSIPYSKSTNQLTAEKIAAGGY